MTNKTVIVTNIIILSCIIVGLVIFLVLGIGSKHEYLKGQNTIISDQKYNLTDFNKLNINVKSYDISFEKSLSSNIEVKVYGHEKDRNKIKIALEKDKLNITQTGSSNYICFGFCYYENKVVIYLPENFNPALDLKTMSGDITSDIPLTNAQNKFKTTSGDIELPNLTKSTVTSTSGEIEIGTVDNLTTKTTSGDITITEVNNLNAISTSGEISITKINNSGTIKTTSGDIDIDNFTITKNSHLESTSGDIKIRLLNNANIITNTISGDKDIKNSIGTHNLEIKTTSGDITVR